MKILVTGANGFVGRCLVRHLAERGHAVTGTVRREFEGFDPAIHRVIREGQPFGSALDGVEAVVHAAGVAHRPSMEGTLFLSGNRDWTVRIAEEVARSGVRALVHLSSIAAFGVPQDRACLVAGLRECDEGNPRNLYGRSKREAEPAVEGLEESGVLGVNLRPPLIYGPGAPGNWAKLLKLVALPCPLPFASVDNRRSYLGIGSLCEAIDAVLAAAGSEGGPQRSGTYHLAEAEPVSLREIVTVLRSAMGKPRGLFPFPSRALEAALGAVGKASMADGLFGDLVVDSSKFREIFGWNPSNETLDAMARSVGSAQEF